MIMYTQPGPPPRLKARQGLFAFAILKKKNQFKQKINSIDDEKQHLCSTMESECRVLLPSMLERAERGEVRRFKQNLQTAKYTRLDLSTYLNTSS